MLRPEEVERLSRYAAGELTTEERRNLEIDLAARPELRRALQRLRALDAVSASVAEELKRSTVDGGALTAVERHTSRSARLPKLAVAAGGLLAVAAVVFAFIVEQEPPQAPAPEIASVDSRVIVAKFGPAWVAIPEGGVLMAEGAEVVRSADDRIELRRGSILAQGRSTVSHGSYQFEIEGAALVSTEPENAVQRVTAALDQTFITGSDQMRSSFEKQQWKSQLAFATTLVLVAFDGFAEVRATGADAKRIQSGEAWSPGRTAKLALASKAKSAPPQPAADVKNKPAGGEGCDSCAAMSELGRTIEQARGDLDRCTASCEDGSCAGQFQLHATIVERGGAGRLEQATIDQDYSVRDPLVASCVINTLAKLSFPVPANGTSRVTLPFIVNKDEKTGRYAASLPRFIDVGPAKVAAAPSFALAHAPAKGPANAPITIVEYSEFECPFCVRSQATLRQVEQAYPGQIRLVFKQMPMPFHPHARLAAAASLAAHEQGKFWEYQALLFERTNALDRASLLRYASELNLDVAKFQAALDDGRFNAVIDADFNEAKANGAQGTPSFFVNGRLIQGAQPFESFKKVIDEELARARR